MKHERPIVCCVVAGILVILAWCPYAPAGTVAVGESVEAREDPTLVRAVRPLSDEPAQRVFYWSYANNERELLSVRDRLLEAGARAVSTSLPDAVVCELPLRVDPAAIASGTGLVWRTQPLDGAARVPVLPAHLDWLRLAYETIDARRSGLEPDRVPAAGGATGDLAEVSTAAIERSKWLAERKRTLPDRVSGQDDRLPDQNTEFLAGNIHMQIVFVEQKDSHSWTTTEQGEVKAALEFVKIYYERHFRSVGANFTFRTFDGEVGWEPLDNGLNESVDIPPLIDDIMNRMGYVGDESDYIDRVNDFNNEARLAYRNADWVFTAFVVDSSHDPDHSFAAKKQIYASLGGPFMVLAYPAIFPGMNTFESLFRFGLTILFWGLPEDMNASPGICDDRSGYLNVRHGNEITQSDPVYGDLDCDGDFVDLCTAMLGHMLFGYNGLPCEFTLGHLGNVDLDNDNVPDVFDAPPAIVFHGPVVDTLTSLQQPVQLTVRSQAVINQNPWQHHERRNYATEIERVSYYLNGIGPILVNPVDGIADEIREEYEIQIPFLLPGYSVIEVTAWNNFGARSAPRDKQLYFLGLDYFSFRFEHKNNGIGVAWYLRGQTFNADQELHRVSCTPDSTDTIIAGPGELQPVKPPQGGLTPYYFLDRTAAAGHRYRYYIKGSFDHWYDGATRTFTSDSQVYETFAAIPRADGILSVPAPNPFQPGAGDERILLSVNVPGAEGIPLVSRLPGPNGASAQQQTPEPIGLKVGVYDVAGRTVKILFDRAVYDPVVNVEWDGNNANGAPVPSGVYFIKARAAEVSDTKKILVIR